jgi:hypothetical protein
MFGNPFVQTTNNTTSQNTTSNLVTYTQSIPFVLLNSTNYLGAVTFVNQFNDSFMIKGNNLNLYLSQNTHTHLCLAVKTPNATNEALILSGKVRKITNFSTGKIEHYLQFQMFSNQNQTDCSNEGFTTAVQNLLAAENYAYAMSDVCSGCTNNVITPNIHILKPDGTVPGNLSFSNLNFIISASSNTTVIPGGSSVLACTSNSSCTAQSYDCCQAGQCVKDGQVKSSIDQNDADFLIVKALVSVTPALYSSFPQYYNICSTQIPTTPANNGIQGDSILESNYQLETLFDLYQCTTPDSDGLSLCTSYHKDASKNVDAEEGGIFEAAIADQNFSFTGSIAEDTSTISEVKYAGMTLFKEGEIEADSNKLVINEDSNNDDLETAQTVTLLAKKPNNAPNDILSIKYKANGTCERLSSTMARCTQKYIQGQMSDPPKISDHEADNLVFNLPSYTNPERPVTVKVNGVNLAQGSSTWSFDGDDGAKVEFNRPVYPNQTVEITYFAQDELVESLTDSVFAAQTQLNKYCNCGDLKCQLQPVYVLNTSSGKNDLKSFNCVYPTSSTISAPLQQVVYVNSKSVPHRFFDEFGVNYDRNRTSANIQEGAAFRYTNNDQNRPNNVEEYIGFNEIYGSFSGQTNAAMPAQVINVTKGKSYDLYVDTGSFSTCINCGSDYNNSLQKIFPNNFTSKGGGYTPDFVESSRFDNAGAYRADDLLFGRACFVPATMIAFSHVPNDDVAAQRVGRLNAQHMYFANGYQRDWYGFDYGSLLGSFDGVTWFSIGNQRRIQSNTNRLYLAINAYYGDLTTSSSFKVTVSEVTINSASGNQIDHDLETNGALCQQHHLCSTDNDCIKNLGYEYACSSVSGITTNWPMFDNNANEIPAVENKRLLASLVGGTNGQTKRCVYRGRGAPCLLDPYDSSSAYAVATNPALYSCAPNFRCQALEADTEAFNLKIARFGRSPSSQNTSTWLADLIGKSDTVGLAARVLGRPLNYFGSEALPEESIEHFNSLGVQGICVPGKAHGESDYASVNAATPSEAQADKILNSGITNPEENSPSMYALCPVTDDIGNYLKNTQNYPLDDETVAAYAPSQNISSQVLAHSDFESLTIFNDLSEQITKKGINQNSCLRAPGASCFTDLDCAPSKFISDQVSKLTTFSLNQAEANFWKEELICGQAKSKYLPLSTQMNPAYDVNDNKCCREVGKDITIYSGTHEDTAYFADRIAGQDNDQDDSPIPLNDERRYSRVHTVYDRLKLQPEKYSPLIAPKANPDTQLGIESILGQYNTFHLAASRTCCSSNWVRNFADENGGGHHWVEGKTQRIQKQAFKCISWFADTGTSFAGPGVRFECNENNWNTPECEIRNLTNDQQNTYLKWIEKFELIGIPQIPIETNQDVYCLVNDIQSDISADKTPLPGTIKKDVATEITDGSKEYYSAGDMSNFDTGTTKIKKIFSDNKVSCCLPTGSNVDSTTTDEMCCTGKVFSGRCCLEDYTDVTLYLNRYVSSEAAHLPDSQFELTTGYMKSPAAVKQLAVQKNICCSGKMAYGQAINSLMIPGVENIQEARVNRFTYADNLTDNNNETGNIGEIYNKGVRWNNHLYCVPSSFQDPSENQ